MKFMYLQRFSMSQNTHPIRWFTLTLLLISGLAAANSEQARSLSFRHTHTGETLSVIYWQDGKYDTDALQRINHFLRDFRTGDAASMDPELLDLLHTVYGLTGSAGQYEIISAYRSPKTNEMLRSRSGGVAKKSQHLLGKAIDVRLTDVPIEAIRKVAFDLGVGGIGFYSRSNFVHLDTGRFRTW
jgi:uncharacterized protein YcbK (DUF882 family)